MQTVQVLLEHGVNIEATNDLGRTALAAAAEQKAFSMVQVLIQHGANLRVQDKFGKNPLVIAVESFRCVDDEPMCTTVVKTLLDHGSKVNATDQYGRSLLHHLPEKVAREFCNLFFYTVELRSIFEMKMERPLYILQYQLETEFVLSGSFSKVPMWEPWIGNIAPRSTQLLIGARAVPLTC